MLMRSKSSRRRVGGGHGDRIVTKLVFACLSNGGQTDRTVRFVLDALYCGSSMKPSRLPLKSHIGDPSPLINVRFRQHRTRNQIVARRMSLIGALITSLALLVSTPGVANADQFRNNQWVFGSIEREFIDFLSGANKYGQGGTSSIGEPTSGELYGLIPIGGVGVGV